MIPHSKINQQLTALPALFRAPYRGAYEALFSAIDRAHSVEESKILFKDHGLERNALMFFHSTRLTRETLKENALKVARGNKGEVFFVGTPDAPENSLGARLNVFAKQEADRLRTQAEMEHFSIIIPLTEKLSRMDDGDHRVKVSGEAAMAIAEYLKMVAQLGKKGGNVDHHKADLGRVLSGVLSQEFGITITSAKETVSLDLDNDEVIMDFTKAPEPDYSEDPSP